MHNVAQLRRLRERFPDTLVVIGVHSAKFPSERLTENIREAIIRYGIEHPVVNDAGFKVWNAYNVHVWPTIVLIDPEGRVVGGDAGEIQAEDYFPILERMIQDFEAQGLLDSQPLEIELESGFVPQTVLSYPTRICIAGDGRAYIADTRHNRIIETRLNESGGTAQILRVFGSGMPELQDGPENEAAFNAPHGMALLRNKLYVADTDNHAIRAIDLESGLVHTVAGTGGKGRSRVMGGSPREIPLRSPWALLALAEATEEGHDVLLIAMAGSHQIWILLDEQRLGVFAGNGREALVDGPLQEASFNQPSDLTLGLGHLIVADAEASAIRAISLGDEPRVFTLVGQGLFEFGDMDGVGADVRLQHAAGITFNRQTLYIADSYNHKIKTLDPATGRVETLAGTGEPGSSDGAFDEATFYQPEGLAYYAGKLYVADTNNHRIRILDLEEKTVSTLILQGLDQLTGGSGESNNRQPNRLEAVEGPPGKFTITFNLQLPEGYKLNTEAPSSLRIWDDGEAGSSIEVPVEKDGTATFEVNLAGDRELNLDLTLYYCQESDVVLCMIHDELLVLPVRADPMASGYVRVDYAPELPGKRMKR